MWRLWSWAMGGPTRYRMAMASVRLGVRMARFLPWHFWELGAWTRGRELPKVPGGSFRAWWKKNGASIQPQKPRKETSPGDEQS